MSTGYFASIEYSSRGWISGEKNHFKCLIRKNGTEPKDCLYKIEGQWSGKSIITDYNTRLSEPFLDVNTLKEASAKVKPIKSMGKMESRRLWQKVSDAIRNNDNALAAKEKSLIENQKRAEQKEREEKGVKWEPKYFKWVENEPIVENLQSMLNKVVTYRGDPIITRNNGNWVYKGKMTTLFRV